MNSEKYLGKYRIKSSRLSWFDYSRGIFFITICVKDRKKCFGKIIETHDHASVHLSDLGKIAQQYWQEIPNHFPNVILDEFIIMPDHLHGIIEINNKEMHHYASAPKGNKFAPQSRNLASIIRGFKGSVKKWAVMNNHDFQWQSRYYDRIIWNHDELSRVGKYIRDNPKNYKY